VNWVRPTGTGNLTPFHAVVAGQHVGTFGDAIKAAGGGHMPFMSGSGMCFGTVNDRVIGFFNKNTADYSNIPVIMDHPDADGIYHHLLVKEVPPSRCTNSRPSPKDPNTAFIGRWAISRLDAPSMQDVVFTDHHGHELIDCFLQDGKVVSYWGNFKVGGGNDATGNAIYRSESDLGDTNQTVAWRTTIGRYPDRAICIDSHDHERILYVSTKNLHAIREIKRVHGELQDTELVNLRTMPGGLEDTLRAEAGRDVPLPSETPIRQLLADPNMAGVFYAIIGSHGMPNWWRSTDNGVTWQNISANAPRTGWTAALQPLTGELIGFSSMGMHVHPSPDIPGYPALPHRDAYTAQLKAYFAAAHATPPLMTAEDRPSLEEPLRDRTTALTPRDPGRFTGEGWQVTSPDSQLMWDLGQPAASGTIEFEVKGDLQQSGKRVLCALWNTPAGSEKDAAGQPVPRVSFLQLRLMDDGMMLRLTGSGPKFTTMEKFTGPLAWPARDQWVHFKIVFGTRDGAPLRFFRDGIELRHATVAGDIPSGFRYVFLGRDNYKRAYTAIPGLTFRNVRIYDVKPAASS
jgi:hypothetical protein